MNLNYDSLIGSGFNPFSEQFRTTVNDLARVVGRWSEAEEAVQQLLAKEERVFTDQTQVFGELAIVSVATSIATNRWKYRLMSAQWDAANSKWTAGVSVLTQSAYNLQENNNDATTIGNGQPLATTPATTIVVSPIAAGTPVLAIEHPTVDGAYFISAANPLEIICQ